MSDEPAFVVQQRLESAIADALVEEVGSGVPVRLIVRALASTWEPELVDLRTEPPRRLFAPDRADDLAQELRAAMYVDGAGTWFTMRLTTSTGGAIDAEFDYDHEPEWSVPVDPVAYVTDLERFPREESARPSWLRDRVAEASAR